MNYLLPSSIYLTEEVLLHTPPPVMTFIQEAVEEMLRLKKLVEELKTRLGMNSSNSSKPPSSDPPWRKKDRGATPKKRPGGKIGHTGHGQKLRVPTDVQAVLPGPCRCGNMLFPKLEEYHTHQLIELPEIEMDVTHFVLHRAKCPCCG